ncbi:MAG: hypothetical protein JWQ87_2036 [Candidatus Sulfotelmatobacter sp.]|nr:hypothetical protein [Candidatus Sulfotelmatobacter sp.]
MEDYSKEVKRAVLRYMRERPQEAKEDAEQECYLALLKAGANVRDSATAYRVARTAVRDFLEREYGSVKRRRKVFNAGRVGGPGKDTSKEEKRRVEFVSISDPAVAHRISRQPHEFDLEQSLDSGVAREALYKLPVLERRILMKFFGIDQEKETIEEIAAGRGRNTRWVLRTKARALALLRQSLRID